MLTSRQHSLATDNAAARGIVCWHTGHIGQNPNRIAFIDEVLVRPDCRRQGYATQLFDQMAQQEAIKADPLHSVHLLVLKDNRKAVYFYRKLGFRCARDRSQHVYQPFPNQHYMSVQVPQLWKRLQKTLVTKRCTARVVYYPGLRCMKRRVRNEIVDMLKCEHDRVGGDGQDVSVFMQKNVDFMVAF